MIRAALILSSLAVLVQGGTGAAQADADSFLVKLNNGSYLPNLHFNQPSSVLLDAGYQVCALARAGTEQRALIQSVLHSKEWKFDAVQATALVNIAEEELCLGKKTTN